MAALARVHLGRVLRAVGQVTRPRAVLEETVAWHRAAAVENRLRWANASLPRSTLLREYPAPTTDSSAILDDARRNDAAHVEVFALDGLARLAAEAGDIVTAHDLSEIADQRMEAASTLHHRPRPSRRPLGQRFA